jgi:hypothetical protein
MTAQQLLDALHEATTSDVVEALKLYVTDKPDMRDEIVVQLDELDLDDDDDEEVEDPDEDEAKAVRDDEA